MNGSTGAVSNRLPAPSRDSGPPGHGPGAGTVFQRWPLADTLPLGSLPTAAPCARLHAKHILREWHLAQITEDAELIVSELVTNALQASWTLPGPPPIRLRLLASRELLMIEVWDAQPAPPTPQPHEIDAEGGRGLEIVALLSRQWGCYHPASGGKAVWATLTTTPASP